MKIAGSQIVVTRPVHQGATLAALIQQQGGEAIMFPVIEITDPEDPEVLDAILDGLDDFDLAIFISANAVNFAWQRISAKTGFPATLQIAAVGAATAKALEAIGRKPDIVPANKFNSEALLAEAALSNVSNKKIVIFRGDGGRELLAQTLRERGATVCYAQVYRRSIPALDTRPLLNCLENNQISAIIVTSDQGLQHLCSMVGDAARGLLQNVQLVVLSDRTRQLAQQLGFTKTPVIATNASDQSVLNALADC